MFSLINRKGSLRKLQHRQRPRLSPRLEGLEGRALLSQAGNLLINGDFSLGNTGFTSGYVYNPDPHAYLNGHYVIVHNPSTDISSIFASFGDHTTGTGLMFATDGSTVPNTVVWQETVNVSKTATDYTFSGWAASMGQGRQPGVDPSPATLRFLINGVQVGSDFTVTATDGQWSQFSVPWNSGMSDVATIQIVDVNTAGFGNDFTLDDLSFVPEVTKQPAVTGGGWINSPAGAYAADPTFVGKASFGFNAQYKKEQSIPTGETEFQVADLNFHSTSYDEASLVIAGAKAQYQGSGTIKGSDGTYGFIVTTIDGQASGGSGTDLFRIRIWNKSTGDTVYDTQPGDPDSADPTTPLGGGSIVLHQ